MNSKKSINYHLYVDECGDQNLETFSPTFPIFTLCGILVRDDLVPNLEEQVRTLKQEFWGDCQIILHSRYPQVSKWLRGVVRPRCKTSFLRIHQPAFRSAWCICYCQLLHPERTIHSTVWSFQRCLWPVAIVYTLYFLTTCAFVVIVNSNEIIIVVILFINKYIKLSMHHSKHYN